MLRARSLPLPAVVLAFLASHAPAARAAWPSDPHVNVPLCTATADQQFPKIVSDGAGGAIVVWIDKRDTLATRDDLYMQRVDATGAPRWTADGVALCTAVNDQFTPTITSDGAGGAIVAWADNRSGKAHIYAQRIDAAGVAQWTADGVALCAAANTEVQPAIVSDGAGGAIVAWVDGRSGDHDVYAQRVDAAGVAQWTTDGVALCTVAGDQSFLAIASDGASGAVVTWQDFRSGTSADIYTQRVSAAGVPQWTADGVALCLAVGYQQFPMIVGDGAGGAIVTWLDSRGTLGADIYAQRVDAAGVPQWTVDGLALCTAGNNQFNPAITSDGSGGAIVTWMDNRSATSYDVFAQRVNAAGATQWTGDGVALCTAPGFQSGTQIVSDGSGGAIVAWQDARGDTVTHVYARRVNAAGVAQWIGDGVLLTAAPNGQFNPAIVSDGSGGAIVAWDDFRNGSNRDIYAQNINGDGSLGGTVVSVPPPSIETRFALKGVGPNPSTGELRVSFTLPDAAPAHVVLYDVGGRRLESIAVGGLGAGTHVVSLAPSGAVLPPGVYCVSLTQGGRRAFSKVAIVR